MKSQPIRLAAFLAMFLAIAPAAVHAQCMLANPSFEIVGSGGNNFAGWSQFGSLGSSTSASHGALAARVSGPNTGNWDISGYWQGETSASGDRWKVTGTVRVPSSRPLAGTSKAIVNVEWRNSGGGLISYESHDVATAASPRDSNLAFNFTTAAAPANTASARLVLAVLQGPADVQRDAIYDMVTFVKQTTPSLDAHQWDDFASGRTIAFAGRNWRVKGTGVYGPGPNSFSNSSDVAWVDANNRLHMAIKNIGGTWYSSEIALDTPLGYGDYIFTTRGRLDTFEPTTVLGLFIWEYGPCFDNGYLWWNPYNEADIEFSRWGIAGGPNAQFVTQPWDWAGNRHQFYASFAVDEVTSHAIRWRPDRIDYRSWRGGANNESPGTTINSWTYTGPHIPRPDQPRVHINMWQVTGPPTTTQEAVFDGFMFRAWPTAFLAVDDEAPSAGESVSLALGGRNPARGGTMLRCALVREGTVRLTLHDVTGRMIRTLADGVLSAGTHELAWDGRDEEGQRVAPGVYLAKLTTREASASARVVVLR